MLYSVAVDSRGLYADYTDLLIVSASSDVTAREKAEDFIQENDSRREILSSESYIYILGDEAKVIGRLINTDEE